MFGPSRFFSPSTMASADFSQFVVTTLFFFRIRLLIASVRPPRVLTHSFPLYLPYLPQTIPCSYWALALSGVLPSSAALYMVSVRQARVSPPSFFRFCLTTDTLDLGYILPTAGRIRDFHPLERALTGRTDQKTAELRFGGFSVIDNTKEIIRPRSLHGYPAMLPPASIPHILFLRHFYAP